MTDFCNLKGACQEEREVVVEGVCLGFMCICIKVTVTDMTI